jgi:Viral BACON domain
VGTYTGNVTVTSSGALNSSQKISVTLGVTGTPPSGMSLNITPGSLSFSYLYGSKAPGTQSLSIASSGTALQFTANASGGSWLTITPATGSTPATMKVSANPSGLAAGTYNGTITITSSGASNSPQTIPVQLVVSDTSSGRLRVWPPRAVTFEYDSGQGSPAPRNIRVFSTGTPLSFTAAANGGTWLSVTPSGGTTPGALSISVDPTGLASGTYSGTVKLSAPGSTGATVPVILTVTSSHDDEGEEGSRGSETDLRASPYAYDPAGTNSVAASWIDATGASSSGQSDPRVQGLLLSKTSAASNQAQAVVVIRNAEGITLTELGYDIRNGGQCTTKSPRFVVVTSDDVVHKIGCSGGIAQPSPATGWKRLRFDPSNLAQTAPAITPGSKVKSIHIVLDGGPETGASMVVLDNVNINGTFIGHQ